jgi:hypothetical protein
MSHETQRPLIVTSYQGPSRAEKDSSRVALFRL